MQIDTPFGIKVALSVYKIMSGKDTFRQRCAKKPVYFIGGYYILNALRT